MSGTLNPFSALAQSFREGWEWFSGGFANPIIYAGFDNPKPAPAPGVFPSALNPPYQPSQEEIINTQVQGIYDWRVDAIPLGPKEDNTWLWVLGGVGLVLLIKK